MSDPAAVVTPTAVPPAAAAAPAAEPATILTPAAETPKAGETVLTPKEPEKAPEPAAVIPDKYEFKLPNGVTLNPDLQAQFEEVAKAAKLTNEQAQKIVDIEVKRLESVDSSLAAERKSWVEAVRNDKEIGGGNYEATVKEAQSGFNFVASKVEGLRDLMRETGLGDHPVFVKAFKEIGKAIGEDKTRGTSSGAADSSESMADKFYRLAIKPAAPPTT